VLEDLGVRHHFTEILTSDSGFARKPSPEALLFLIDKYGLEKEHTYYIGDRRLDVETAIHAGIHSINLQIDGIKENKKITNLQEIVELILVRGGVYISASILCAHRSFYSYC
jgi:phosphoglycolate phosphatase-like HAD superfamily hydrolase